MGGKWDVLRGKKDNEPSIRREIRSPGAAPGGSTVAELAPQQPQVAPTGAPEALTAAPEALTAAPDALTGAPEAPTAPPGEGVTLICDVNGR